ncbi:MAG: hypothetical protein Q4E69_05955 [Bacilli bacterium]|nr:hypothetical protein [Bacilli bacterium]
MKRLVLLLFAVLLLMTGCTVTTLSNVDVGSNIKTILTDKAELYNVYFEGYKYYVPKGLQFVNKDQYNAKFTDSVGNKYYLYVDAISYFHKIENTYEENETSHYSRKLNYGKKTGYIQIDKQEDGKYLINFMFNYAKMEAYVSEEDLISVVNNMAYVLRSITFNDKVLESLIGENILSYQEETFNLFDTKSASTENFLDEVAKYDKNYKKSIDEDKIDLDDE